MLSYNVKNDFKLEDWTQIYNCSLSYRESRVSGAINSALTRYLTKKLLNSTLSNSTSSHIYSCSSSTQLRYQASTTCLINDSQVGTSTCPSFESRLALMNDPFCLVEMLGTFLCIFN